MSCGKIDLECTRCRLSKGRTRVVPGVGPCDAKVFFIGEAPGKDEDIRGEPFVGRAGRILDEALRDVGVTRDQVYISNLVKCRPAGNRRPRKDEIGTCTGLYLASELREVSPVVVCALGQTVAEHLLGEKVRMTKAVGTSRSAVLGDVRANVVVAYHPAACLYQRRNLSRFKKAVRASLAAASMV